MCKLETLHSKHPKMFKNLKNLKHKTRNLSLFSSLHQYKALKPQTVSVDWNRAVLEAEKVVGYPTSFLNLRWLLNDEIANIAQHLKRLIGTEHPILNTARGILTNQLPAWGLIVLLVSKSIGLNRKVDEIEKDLSSGILHTQRVLAEVTEMIRTSYLIHQGLFNINSNQNVDEALKDDMHFGNKIALLTGDYLLSKSYHELANIKNHDVNQLLSTALRDLTECEFMGVRDSQNKAIPSEPNSVQVHVEIRDETNNFESISTAEAMGNMESEWIVRNLLGGGTLLGKSCQCVIKLAGFDQDMEQNGYRFGKHLALAWQASIDLLEFQSGKFGRFNLVGAPLMYHLVHQPSNYSSIKAGLSDINIINYTELRRKISDGPALQMAEQLRKRHATKASEMLNTFGNGDAKSALKNIIEAM